MLELLLKRHSSESIFGFIIKVKNQVFNRMKFVDSEHRLALKYLLANSCVIPSCEDSRWRLVEFSDSCFLKKIVDFVPKYYLGSAGH